jgi:hypothetical protein
MGKLSRIDVLRYRPLFSAVCLAVAITLCAAVGRVADRVLLPVLSPCAGAGAEPLRVVNNDGTLSNGDQLTGWRNRVYFLSFALAWMASTATVVAALVRVWPAKAPDRTGG